LKNRGPAPKLFGASPIPELRDRFKAAKIASNEMYLKQHPDSGAVTEQEHSVMMRDGFSNVIRIYQPRHVPVGGSPLSVIYHGGGYCLGGLENEHINCRNLCEKFGFVVVNAAYRLAPENPFPAGLNDSYDTLKWVSYLWLVIFLSLLVI
jgi:acetyl esterase/lipase